jgi:hypothetical protein
MSAVSPTLSGGLEDAITVDGFLFLEGAATLAR